MKTAVITGASSGIGELTAIKLAAEGYNVVLAARREYPLQEIAEKCRNYGVKAIVVPADVSSKEQIEHLAATAIKEFGEIDVWVNNAGVIMYGRFLDVTPKEFRQTIETNLFGVVYGSREALTQFRAQGNGTLINIASGYGAIPAPYASAYITSKFAVRGLSASLREEIVADGIKDIHVCTILPATMDTPVYASSGNKMNQEVRPLPPVFPPEAVADTVLKLLENPRAEVAVGRSTRIPIVLYNMFPQVFTTVFAKYVRKLGFDKKAPSSHSSGNLFIPSTHTGARGGWKTERQRIKKVLPFAAVIVVWFFFRKKRSI